VNKARSAAGTGVGLGAASNFSEDLLMADQNDIILNTINQQMDQARHSEDQRSTLTNILLGIVVVLQGFIVQRGFDKPSMVAAVGIVLFGILGLLTSLKLYERFKSHSERVSKLEEWLDNRNSGLDLRKTLREAREQHESEFPKLSRLRLHILWRLLHVLIVLVGIVNATIILVI
jgi:hypothetical protein